MRNATLLLAALAAVTSAAAAMAQDKNGDAAAGARLAQRWCSSCHQPNGNASATYPASSFVAIARLPSTTAMSLRVFLRTSHPSMPNVQLTPADTDDLVAYILSLK